MTNGENILNGFSNATIRRCKNEDFIYIEVEQNDKWIADFNIEWWNTEYKEPTTKNDLEVDAVRREEVDRLACRYLKEPTDNHVAFYEEFLDLPSVTPIRPKGHWIDGHCSECGCDVPAYIVDWKWQKDMDAKFCPNCGADMREVEK